MESTGIKELDAAFGGGIDLGRIILLKAPPGSGKIVLGYTFLQHGLSKGQSCFYMFYKESTLEAISDVRKFGIDPATITFVNANPVYERDLRHEVVIMDLSNPGTFRNLDQLFKQKVPARGLITVISKVFSSRTYSSAFYLLGHLKRLLKEYPDNLVVLTMERGIVSDEDIRDVEDSVDVIMDMIPKTSTDGELIIKRSYKPVVQNGFFYHISQNKFSVVAKGP